MIFLPFFNLARGGLGEDREGGVVFGDKASKSKHTLGRQGASRIGKSYQVYIAVIKELVVLSLLSPFFFFYIFSSYLLLSQRKHLSLNPTS